MVATDYAELGTESKQEAYIALRATLHTLRDRLPLEVVAHLGAQLPMLVRGIYYEGWKPSLEVCKLHYDEFLACVMASFVRTSLETSDPEPAIRAVFHTLASNIAPGETQKVMGVLPANLRSLLGDSQYDRFPGSGDIERTRRDDRYIFSRSGLRNEA